MKPDSVVGIRTRIYVGFGALVFVLLVILITAYLALDESQRAQRRILEYNFSNLYDLPNFRANLNAQRLMVALLLESPEASWDSLADELESRRKTADSLINNLILRFRDFPDESERLGVLIATRDRYNKVQDFQLELMADGKKDYAKELFLRSQMENYARMRSVAGELEEMELREARDIVGRAEDDAALRGREFLLLGVIGIVMAAALAVYMSRTISSYVFEVGSAEKSGAKATRALKMLNASRAAAIRAHDETQLLEDVCRAIIEMGSYKMAWVGYADDDKNKSVRAMAYAGEDGEYIEHAKVSWGDNERGRGPTGTCIRTGEVVIARDTSTEPGFEPWRFRAVEKGYRSSATIPLRCDGRTYGALMVYSSVADAFDETEIELLKELANDLAYSTTSLRDQSARSMAEKRARESAAYARSLLEASVDPLIAVSPLGKITDVNLAMEEAIGQSRAELVGRDFSECFWEPKKAEEGHRRVLTDGTIRDFALTLRHKSGLPVSVMYSANIYRNDSGELQGVFASVRENSKG